MFRNWNWIIFFLLSLFLFVLTHMQMNQIFIQHYIWKVGKKNEWLRWLCNVHYLSFYLAKIENTTALKMLLLMTMMIKNQLVCPKWHYMTMVDWLDSKTFQMNFQSKYYLHCINVVKWNEKLMLSSLNYQIDHYRFNNQQ